MTASLATSGEKAGAGANGLLAIIGGSGLYDLPGLTDTAWVTVDTPWGAPSDQVFTGTLASAAGPGRRQRLRLPASAPVFGRFSADCGRRAAAP